MKRKRQSRAQQRENKRVKQDGTQRERPSQPLLRNYYPEVVTLRQYLVSKLVKPSKRTRRRILQNGRDGSEADERVTRLLDTTVIGAFESVHIPSEEAQSIENEIKLFSQQIASDRSSVSLTPNEFKQAQVRTIATDFYTWFPSLVSMISFKCYETDDS
jgi:telomerase reverse transcriptase